MNSLFLLYFLFFEKIVNSIGATRILILEILYYICKLTAKEKNCLINEINPTIWHHIEIWFFSNRSKKD